MEPTLAAQFTDLSGDVGLFLGYGRGAANGESAWTSTQQSDVTRCVKGGLRAFYHCGFPWSFLRPTATLALASGARTVDLPEDFGGVEGRLTLSSSTQVWWPVDFTNEGAVREKYAVVPSATGRPQMAAVEPLRGTTQGRGQRFRLYLYPQADAAYTLQLTYYLNPDYLTGQAPYAYGGAEHAETLLAACRAAAERDLDNVLDGPQQVELQRRLAISQQLDRRKRPLHLGYNGDRSDWPPYDQRRQCWASPVSVGGVTY